MEYLFVGGLVVSALGLVWLLLMAFQKHWSWGVGGLLFPPSLLVFIARNFRQAKAPIGVVFAGLVLAFSPAIYTRMVPVDLGPHEAIVNGERHLTLTGWDRKDYSVIAFKPDTIVLQMANEDVKDKTMEYLKPLQQLRELDISFSEVTDEGLDVIAELPELQTLHIQGLKITDAGFKKLMEHPKLTQINLTGTQVSADLVTEWMTSNPTRMALF